MRKDKFFEEMINEIPLPVIFIERNPDFRVRYVNPAAASILAHSLADLCSDSMKKLFPQIPSSIYDNINKVIDEGVAATASGVFYENRQGEEFVLRIVLLPLRGGVLIVGENLLQASMKIHHQSAYDPLTRLLRRDVFLDLASEELLACQSRGSKAALLMIDLDKFKNINDSRGHHAGDETLREVAGKLVGLVRYHDLLGRLGGDEMVLFVAEADEELAEEIARRITSALGEPSASVGIAMAEDGESLEGLLRRADEAMYEAKRAGGGRWRIKSP